MSFSMFDGLRIRRIRGDGDCLFNALSDQMTDSTDANMHYREMICLYMRSHLDEFSDVLLPNPTIYLSNMSQSGVWGDHTELQAFSRWRNVEIHVHRSDGSGTNVISPVGNAPIRTLHLLYNGVHYDSLRSDDSQDSNSKRKSDIPSRDGPASKKSKEDRDNIRYTSLHDICDLSRRRLSVLPRDTTVERIMENFIEHNNVLSSITQLQENPRDRPSYYGSIIIVFKKESLALAPEEDIKTLNVPATIRHHIEQQIPLNLFYDGSVSPGPCPFHHNSQTCASSAIYKMAKKGDHPFYMQFEFGGGSFRQNKIRGLKWLFLKKTGNVMTRLLNPTGEEIRSNCLNKSLADKGLKALEKVTQEEYIETFLDVVTQRFYDDVVNSTEKDWKYYNTLLDRIKYYETNNIAIHRKTSQKSVKKQQGKKPSRLICKFCGKVFADFQNLTKHIVTHTKEKTHLCYFCQKLFGRSDHLIMHLRTHTGERPYKCLAAGCRRTCTNTSALLNHRKSVHERRRDHVCGLCKKAFYTRVQLRRHMGTVHKDGKNVPPKPKTHKCPHCPCSYVRMFDLSRHVKEKHPEK